MSRYHANRVTSRFAREARDPGEPGRSDRQPRRDKEYEGCEGCVRMRNLIDRRTSGEQPANRISKLLPSNKLRRGKKIDRSTAKRPGSSVRSGGIYVVLKMILLAVTAVGPVCRTGPLGLGMGSDGGAGTSVSASMNPCTFTRGSRRARTRRTIICDACLVGQDGSGGGRWDGAVERPSRCNKRSLAT